MEATMSNFVAYIYLCQLLQVWTILDEVIAGLTTHSVTLILHRCRHCTLDHDSCKLMHVDVGDSLQDVHGQHQTDPSCG